MPHVINGIGTWYYGKRNVHRLRNLCSQCGAVNDLESYDTTLYFVVFFVPLVPLGSKRILDSCPACNRHRMIPLGKWRQIKADAEANILEKLRADPDNRETILEAIGVATSFQDEGLFDKMSSVLASDRTDDAELQLALAGANSYFARHGEAVTAYMHSLRVKDDPRVREQLGLTLLRLGDPEQAAGCFKHILEEADGERLWFLYQLAVAYQAKGMHTEALELLDRVQEKFPATETVKDWQKLRKISAKDGGRNRPVGTSLLKEGKSAGTHEGSRLGATIPLLVLPLLLLAFVTWHTWRSVTLASARPMYLVNGTAKPYTVAVNGTPYQINPGTPTPVDLPEGTLALTPGPGAVGVEPAEVQVASTFWARPYDGTVIVLNPDRLAILSRESRIYSTTPMDDETPDEFYAGKPLYELASANYKFEPFPDSIQSKNGRTVTKTRVGLAEIAGPESRLAVLSEMKLSPAEQAEYGRRWLASDPDNALVLAWFSATAPKDDVMAALRSRLGDRPLRIEWHRAYQSLAERYGEDRAKLRDEYRKLVGELPGDPDALYLLARVSDREESDKLLREAVTSGKPAERAHYALAVRALCEGDYPTASAEADRFPGLKGNNAYQHVTTEVYLAAKRYRDLEKLMGEGGVRLSALREKLRVCELAGDTAGADQAAAALTGQLPPQAVATLRPMLDAMMATTRAAAKGEAKAYLAAIERMPGKGSVVTCLLKNDLAGAGSAASPAAAPDATVERGLILLATPPTDAEKFSAAKTAFLDALSASDHEEKELRALLEGGKEADPVKAIRESVIMPSKKRVFAAAAAVWYPNQKAELVAFARKLDFHRDETSLVLNQVLGTPAKKPAPGKAKAGG